ncbi:MAG TPA: hypothetical protein DCR52_05875, partial [Actinobacteria bacterium]|nr:hypothetical protein [Actinomycetota bacterium]
MTTTVVENDVDNALVADQAREITTKVDRPDLIFRGIIRTSGIAVLTVMSLIGVFLAYRAAKALDVAGWSFVTEQAWEPDSGKFGVAAIIVGTVLIAVVAICIAVPLAIAVALYISEYAPRRLQSTFVSLVDLMAAVPSIVYGLWGFFFL